MFDLSNPQKRERFLVIVTGIALFLAAAILAPGQFAEIARKKIDRDRLIKDIENHQRHARNKETIQSRLSAMEGQALTSGTGSGEAALRYQNWLRDLATGSGLGNPVIGVPSTTGRKEGSYTKHTFTVSGTGRLDQIAEFLRRFHRTEYLHMIQNFQPRPVANQPGMFNVTFRIEALSLPQVSVINVPSIENIPAMTDEERQTLTDIRNRAILSEYTPPRSSNAENERASVVPPSPPFDEIPYCFVTGVVETDGKPQCWIENRVTGRTYYLFEEGTFTLSGLSDSSPPQQQQYRCTIKKIDIDTQQIIVDIAGGLYAVRVGKDFDNGEAVESPPEPATGNIDTIKPEPDTPGDEPNKEPEM